MATTKLPRRNPREPGRIPPMAELRHAGADRRLSSTITDRPAARVVPRDRRLEQRLVRRVAA